MGNDIRLVDIRLIEYRCLIWMRAIIGKGRGCGDTRIFTMTMLQLWVDKSVLFSYIHIFLQLSNYGIPVQCPFNTRQASPQLNCCASCHVWVWFSISGRCVNKIRYSHQQINHRTWLLLPLWLLSAQGKTAKHAFLLKLIEAEWRIYASVN